MNLPNKLTVVRIVLAPLFLALALWEFPFHYAVSLVVFIAAALTDMLDGKIARSRNLITNLGKFLDPLADKMLTTAAFLLFLAIDKMNVWALMLILTREFMVTSVRLLAAKGGKVIAASLWGKAKTVAQFIAIIFMLTALEFSTWQTSVLAGVSLPDAVFSVPLVIGEVLIWISTVLSLIAGAEYVWLNREYFLDKNEK
ncbi:MAG: CDP-diacylglycerol--glycerol-3-phosphate 3-phosphatidyltransferase [Clostridia bacterium]|nr:CDP-diacylglycerol--glycerol-3-phosphate 3-phosphatidyltransferase [Clostridia bacterium]